MHSVIINKEMFLLAPWPWQLNTLPHFFCHSYTNRWVGKEAECIRERQSAGNIQLKHKIQESKN